MVSLRMKPLAAIDIGTNTIRMLVAERDGKAVRPLYRARRITAMGRELRTTGAIGRKELLATVSTLRQFRKRIDELGVVQYRACGTAVLREAANRDAFLSAAESAGIAVEVISAEEEARRTWDGIHARAPGDGRSIVMDIGGGSTEFIAGPGRGDSVSLPIGVVVVCSLFAISDPPAPWQIRNLRYYFSERIADGTRSWARRRTRRMIGTAGTFTTLAALDRKMTEYRPERIDGYRMSLSRLRRWEARLARLTDAQRLALPGMEKGRERYILPGACMAAAAMEHLGLEELVISDAGLLEGILLGIPYEKGERR